MELDQEVRAFFTTDEQVESKRLNLYVSKLNNRPKVINLFIFYCRKTSYNAKSMLVSQSKSSFEKTFSLITSSTIVLCREE